MQLKGEEHKTSSGEFGGSRGAAVKSRFQERSKADWHKYNTAILIENHQVTRFTLLEAKPNRCAESIHSQLNLTNIS